MANRIDMIAIDAGGAVLPHGGFVITAADDSGETLAIGMDGQLFIRMISAITQSLLHNAPELARYLAKAFEELAKDLRAHGAPERH